MLTLPLGETGTALLALGVVVAMFVLFVRERYPAEVTALAGAAFMLLVGIVPYDAARDVLSNPAPWTILAMFLIMGGLVRTGALDWLTRKAEAQADHRPLVTLSILFLFVAFASAFMNNTPVVVVMIPVFIQVARKARPRAVEAPDPAELRRDPRRHDDADRHLDEPARRRRRAVEGDGALRHLRDPAARRAPGRHRASPTSRFVGRRLLPDRQSMSLMLSRPTEAEILHGSGCSRRFFSHRTEARRRSISSAGTGCG
jgi:hypothetical protein